MDVFYYYLAGLCRDLATIGSCAAARFFGPRSIERSLSMASLLPVVRVLTIHCHSGGHVVRLIILLDTSCRSCMEEGKVETSQHFLLVYPAFAISMLKHLGTHIFRCHTELVGIEIECGISDSLYRRTCLNRLRSSR